jgi:hypothetical protein
MRAAAQPRATSAATARWISRASPCSLRSTGSLADGSTFDLQLHQSMDAAARAAAAAAAAHKRPATAGKKAAKRSRTAGDSAADSAADIGDDSEDYIDDDSDADSDADSDDDSESFQPPDEHDQADPADRARKLPQRDTVIKLLLLSPNAAAAMSANDAPRLIVVARIARKLFPLINAARHELGLAEATKTTQCRVVPQFNDRRRPLFLSDNVLCLVKERVYVFIGDGAPPAAPTLPKCADQFKMLQLTSLRTLWRFWLWRNDVVRDFDAAAARQKVLDKLQASSPTCRARCRTSALACWCASARFASSRRKQRSGCPPPRAPSPCAARACWSTMAVALRAAPTTPPTPAPRRRRRRRRRPAARAPPS